ncbi:MAG: hypothetical protein JF587_23725 [Catenulisporales bacterium]|nr:hypothetical protein [Catenulisporales bacterium]
MGPAPGHTPMREAYQSVYTQWARPYPAPDLANVVRRLVSSQACHVVGGDPVVDGRLGA